MTTPIGAFVLGMLAGPQRGEKTSCGNKWGRGDEDEETEKGRRWWVFARSGWR